MKCPGQDTQYWKPGAIFEANCPECGAVVEFFKDDTTRKCGKCGHRFLNPEMDFGCASYCQFAEQCLGDLPPELIAQKEDFLKDRVAIEMKRFFKRDFKRIGRASRVARYAERIGIREKGSNLAVVLAAAYLREIGAPNAERKHGQLSPELIAQESPAMARAIMEKLGAPEKLIIQVCEIIAQQHLADANGSVNRSVVHDAVMIAELEERQKEGRLTEADLQAAMEAHFLTLNGAEEAKTVLGA
jgi:hypothetical protein